MSNTRQMRRAFERDNREALIGLAAQRRFQDILRPRPRFVPRFIWATLIRIILNPRA